MDIKSGSLDDATSKVRSNFNKVGEQFELGVNEFNMFRDSMAKAQLGVLLFSNTLRAGVLGLGKFAKMLNFSSAELINQ